MDKENTRSKSNPGGYSPEHLEDIREHLISILKPTIDDDKLKNPKHNLIILGNGFDLAHGYKTNYSDFIEYLFKKEIEHSLKRAANPDYSNTLNFNKVELALTRGSDSVLEDLYENTTSPINENIFKWTQRVLESRSAQTAGVKLLIHSGILARVFDTFEQKENSWASLEEIFFELLKKTKKEEKVKELNEDLDWINIQLSQYLIEQLDIEVQVNLKEKEIITTQISEILFEGNNLTYILNFNYTDIIKGYLSIYHNRKTHVNNIHGKLSDDGNPPFLGYGDENNSEIERWIIGEAKESLTHIKSFKYILGAQYQHLMAFLDGNIEYDIHIMGHGCTDADGTLLKTILNKPNCKHVKIYRYNEEDFKTKAIRLAKHIDAPARFREMVVNIKQTEVLGQPGL